MLETRKELPDEEINRTPSNAASDLSVSFWEDLLSNEPASTFDAASNGSFAQTRGGGHVEVDGKDGPYVHSPKEETGGSELIEENSLRVQSNIPFCAPHEFNASSSNSTRGTSEDSGMMNGQTEASLLTSSSDKGNGKQLDHNGELTLSRRRRSFTADGYVGVQLSEWVTLGEDLWKQGVTLGLEKFLPDKQTENWPGNEGLAAFLTQRENSRSGYSNPPQLPQTVPGSLPKVEALAPSPPSILDNDPLAAMFHVNRRASATAHQECLLPSTSPGSRVTQNQQQQGHIPRVAVVENPAARITENQQQRGHVRRVAVADNPGSTLALCLASTISALRTSVPLSKDTTKPTSGFTSQRVNAKRRSLSDKSCGTRLSSLQGQLSVLSDRPPKRHLTQGSNEVVPSLIAGGLQHHIKSLFILAAQAVASDNSVQFKHLSSRLQPYVKQRGQGWERAAFCLLQSLTLRHQGEGPAKLRRRMRMSIKEMRDGLIWVFSAMPMCPFTAICNVGTLLPRLIGNPHVHLVNIGESFVPKLSNFLRLLASSRVDPRLKSFRLTHVRAFPLCRPGRPEFESVQLPEVVASMVHRTAEDLGIQFSFHGIILKEECLSLLDRVQRFPGEALGVCVSSEIKFFSEELWDRNTGCSALDKLTSCITRLRPDVLSCAEEDVSASCQDLPLRFVTWQDFMWDMYEAGDACIGYKDVRLQHCFEDQYWRQICRSVVGCEGQERRWRPKSGEQQEKIMRSCGLRQLPASNEVLSRVQEMLGSYPEGWAAIEERSGLTLFFRGTRVFRATAWKSVETMNQPCAGTMALCDRSCPAELI